VIGVSTLAGSSSWYLNLIGSVTALSIALLHEALVKTLMCLEEEERTDEELLVHSLILLCKLKVIQVH